MATFKKGDKVTWQSHGGEATGKAEGKITEDTEAAGRTVRASKDDPQYLVKSDKSGGEAVHKPSALERTSKKQLKPRHGHRVQHVPIAEPDHIRMRRQPRIGHASRELQPQDIFKVPP